MTLVKMKILLVSISFNHETWGWYLRRNLLKLGHCVDVFCFRTPAQWINVDSLVAKTFRHMIILNKLQCFKINKELEHLVKKKDYDLVLVLKGELISPKTIRKVKKFCGKVVNWFMDPIITLEKGFLFDAICEYDFFLVKDLFIMKRLHELGFDNVRFLLQCYDPDIYHKTKVEDKYYSSDVTFVGNIYPYRLKLLSALKKYKLKVWGKLVHGVKRKDVNSFYQGRPAITWEKNKIFNAAKIVFNSHNPWEVCGSNVRLFEICGSGGFQLTDKTLYINKIFKIGREIVCYENVKELQELIEYFLANEEERKKISERGYRRARRDHTYLKRINELFRLIKLKP